MAVEKDYFLELGGYDMEMTIFGGESLEFSFLVWMCGGRIKARIYYQICNYANLKAILLDNYIIQFILFLITKHIFVDIAMFTRGAHFQRYTSRG